MKFRCHYCETLTVEVAGTQMLTTADGIERDFVYGRCRACNSFQMSEPSPRAYDLMKAKRRAEKHVAKAS